MPYRLNNGRGETLVETLVALLISAISLMMFAEMLAPAAKLTEKGQSWNAAVNALNTPLEQRNPGIGVVSGGGTISIASGGGKLIDDNAPVTLYIATYSGGEQVISYAP